MAGISPVLSPPMLPNYELQNLSPGNDLNFAPAQLQSPTITSTLERSDRSQPAAVVTDSAGKFIIPAGGRCLGTAERNHPGRFGLGNPAVPIHQPSFHLYETNDEREMVRGIGGREAGREKSNKKVIMEPNNSGYSRIFPSLLSEGPTAPQMDYQVEQCASSVCYETSESRYRRNTEPTLLVQEPGTERMPLINPGPNENQQGNFQSCDFPNNPAVQEAVQERMRSPLWGLPNGEIADNHCGLNPVPVVPSNFGYEGQMTNMRQTSRQKTCTMVVHPPPNPVARQKMRSTGLQERGSFSHIVTSLSNAAYQEPKRMNYARTGVAAEVAPRAQQSMLKIVSEQSLGYATGNQVPSRPQENEPHNFALVQNGGFINKGNQVPTNNKNSMQNAVQTIPPRPNRSSSAVSNCQRSRAQKSTKTDKKSVGGRPTKEATKIKEESLANDPEALMKWKIKREKGRVNAQKHKETHDAELKAVETQNKLLEQAKKWLEDCEQQLKTKIRQLEADNERLRHEAQMQESESNLHGMQVSQESVAMRNGATEAAIWQPDRKWFEISADTNVGEMVPLTQGKHRAVIREQSTVVERETDQIPLDLMEQAIVIEGEQRQQQQQLQYELPQVSTVGSVHGEQHLYEMPPNQPIKISENGKAIHNGETKQTEPEQRQDDRSLTQMQSMESEPQPSLLQPFLPLAEVCNILDSTTAWNKRIGQYAKPAGTAPTLTTSSSQCNFMKHAGLGDLDWNDVSDALILDANILDQYLLH